MHSRTPLSHSAGSMSGPAPVPDRHTVQSVTRALQILDAFQPNELGVSLAELSRRLGMGKPTVLRTARTLALAGYMAQLEDGRWRLGPASGWLGVRYQTSFDVGNMIDSVLRKLAAATGETAALFVAEGSGRSCVARVDKPSLVRQHIRVGEKLPLEQGASGRVLLAFSGQAGDTYDTIRRSGYYVSVSERDTRMSSISIPVFGPRRRLFGALCISGTAAELGRDALMGFLDVVIESGNVLSRSLVSHESADPPASDTRPAWVGTLKTHSKKKPR